jgi:hypothetical protein
MLLEVLAAAELEDAGQIAHVLSAEAPPSAEYLPAMQPVQVLSAEAPGFLEYLPAPQSMHHLAADEPGVVEYFPAPQSMHEAAPVTALNFPASHATHVPPFGPVCPGLHRQSVVAMLAAAELEDALQLAHVLSAEAPGVVEYLPAPQSMHELATVAPVVARYLPAPQSMHEAAPVTALNFPSAQLIQTEAPVFNYVPAPQSVSGIRRCRCCTSWRR